MRYIRIFFKFSKTSFMFKLSEIKKSSFLPSMSFLIGIGSVLSIMGTPSSYKKVRSKSADKIAIKSYWHSIGKDMYTALGKFEQDSNV